MHLGHLKAYFAQHTLNQDSDKANTLKEQRQATLDDHLALLNYALPFGKLFDSWKMVVNAMCQRFTTFKLFICMRQITISFWQSSGGSCCTLHVTISLSIQVTLGPSRTGKQWMLCLLERWNTRSQGWLILPWYILITMQPHAMTELMHDCKSCQQKFGQSWKVCIMECQTLAKAQYHLKAKLGVSNNFFATLPIPSMVWLWARSRWLTFKIAGDEQHIIWQLQDPFMNLPTGLESFWSLQLFLVGSVDDMRNTMNKFGNQDATMEDLCRSAQHDCQTVAWSSRGGQPANGVTKMWVPCISIQISTHRRAAANQSSASWNHLNQPNGYAPQNHPVA